MTDTDRQAAFARLLSEGRFAEAAGAVEQLPALGASPVDLSVVVVTRDRAKVIGGTLEALAALEYPRSRWELVVVDNGSRDDTAAVARRRLASMPCEARVVSQPTGRICAARNAGIRNARGSWVGFIDDDATCGVDWLLQYRMALVARPDAAGMGGPASFPPDYVLPWWWRVGHSQRMSCVFGPDEIVETRLLENPYGLNMWFRRQVLDSVGLFDARLDDWCRSMADETELFYRMQRRGHKVYFVPQAPVAHHVAKDRLELGPLLKRSYLVGRSHRVLDGLYPGEIRLRPTLIGSARHVAGTRDLGPIPIAAAIELARWLGYRAQHLLFLVAAGRSSAGDPGR